MTKYLPVMSTTQKLLLAWSIFLLAAAEVIKHRHFSTLATTIIGGAELALAVLTGVGYALVTLKKNSQ
jgi:hypothetical protein